MKNRMFHRWVSIPLGLIFAVISLTGIALQLDLWVTGTAPPGSDFKGRMDELGFYPNAIDQEMARAMVAVGERYPKTRVVAIMIEPTGETATFLFHPKDAPQGERGVSINLETGEPLAKPKGLLPKLHHILQDIHAGYIGGTIGRIVSLIAGLGLLFLSFTGFMVYFDMLRRRVKAGKKGLFWN